jgi:hypothetical protein
MDAQMLEARLDAGADEAGCPVPDHGRGLRPRSRRLGPDRVGDVASQRLDVVAVIAVVGNWLAAPDRGDRRAQIRDLAADIVEVILARHTLAASLEHAAEQVADERPARVPDRERPGRVGRHELDVDATLRDRDDRAPRVRLGEDPIDDRFQRRGAQPDVDEPGSRDLRRLDRRRGSARRGVADEFRGKERGDLQRRLAIGPRQLHCEVRREIAVRGIRRMLDLDRRPPDVVSERGDRACLDRGIPRSGDRLADLGAQGCRDHGRRPSGDARATCHGRGPIVLVRVMGRASWGPGGPDVAIGQRNPGAMGGRRR